MFFFNKPKRIVAAAYLFDIDGVITDPKTRSITKPELVTLLIDKLHKGQPVGLISGRGLIWIRAQVLSVLENYVDTHPEFERKTLDNLYVSGEFGGVYDFFENGTRKELINQDIAVPMDLRNRLSKTAEEFTHIAKVEHEKQIMFTMETNLGIDFFNPDGEHIAKELREIIQGMDEFEVSMDRLGMNVRNKKANKQYSAQQFLKWVNKKRISPQKYYVFGDSPTDLEMGKELHNQNIPFEFIYVGDKEDLNGKNPEFSLTITQGHCDEGTVEYLKRNREE